MEAPIFEYVLQQLEISKGTWPRIAKETGIPYKTLVKVATGETEDPGVSIVQRLADYFRDRAKAAA